MKNFFVMSVLIISAASMASSNAFATGTAPNLGAANTFGILANTYTNSGTGTSINGNLGYTVAPANPPTVHGTTFISTDATYIAAETAQANAIVFLNNPAQSGTCDHTIASAVDLSIYNAGSGAGVYPAGVYCINGAVTIGATGITLSGNGVHIFRINGAFDTLATSVVSLTNGAQACNVFWVPVGATTLGATSTFVGSILSNAAFTLANNVSMTGKILSDGAVTTTGPSDTITVSSCNGNGNGNGDGNGNGNGDDHGKGNQCNDNDKEHGDKDNKHGDKE